MDQALRAQALAAGDLTAWPGLARDLERSVDAAGAAEALRLLHAQGRAVEAAQWLAHVTDAPDLQALRASLRVHAEGWPVSGLRALTLDLLSGAYRLIPAGSFVMGSPDDEEGRFDDEAQHPVEITQPFLLKATPVTQAEWAAVTGDDPARSQGDDQRPVEEVSWEDAVRFCQSLCAQTGGAYRLPTEAEWEYAARAGATAARYGPLDAVAWYSGNTDRAAHPVGQKQPNGWGLYDMLGNVWEWCQDLYGPYLPPARSPRRRAAPKGGGARVARGGAWCGPARCCRAAHRNHNHGALRSYGVGFRLAGSLEGA